MEAKEETPQVEEILEPKLVEKEETVVKQEETLEPKLVEKEETPQVVKKTPQVVKKKNLKRVEQGKKLAELNRKRKKERLLAETPSTEKTRTPHKVLFGALVVGGVVAVVYFIQRGKEVEEYAPVPQKKDDVDIFDMP
jgi:hypothetical protein